MAKTGLMDLVLATPPPAVRSPTIPPICPAYVLLGQVILLRCLSDDSLLLKQAISSIKLVIAVHCSGAISPARITARIIGLLQCDLVVLVEAL